MLLVRHIVTITSLLAAFPLIKTVMYIHSVYTERYCQKPILPTKQDTEQATLYTRKYCNDLKYYCLKLDKDLMREVKKNLDILDHHC